MQTTHTLSVPSSKKQSRSGDMSQSVPSKEYSSLSACHLFISASFSSVVLSFEVETFEKIESTYRLET